MFILLWFERPLPSDRWLSCPWPSKNDDITSSRKDVDSRGSLRAVRRANEIRTNEKWANLFQTLLAHLFGWKWAVTRNSTPEVLAWISRSTKGTKTNVTVKYFFYVFIVNGTVFQTLPKRGKLLALLKVCLEWKVHLAYPASLQALHSNDQKHIT